MSLPLQLSLAIEKLVSDYRSLIGDRKLVSVSVSFSEPLLECLSSSHDVKAFEEPIAHDEGDYRYVIDGVVCADCRKNYTVIRITARKVTGSRSAGGP